MKFVFLLAALAAALGGTTTPASADRFEDSAQQIDAILRSDQVADAVDHAPIGHMANVGTRKDGAAEWEVRVQHCDLVVFLIPVAGGSSYRIDLPRECR